MIPIERILENEFDADEEDWESILTTLNPDESPEDIKEEIRKAFEEQDKKKEERED